MSPQDANMSTDNQAINLIDKSSTYPDLSFDPLIPLDSKIRELQRKFSPQNHIIILKGSSGSGKTVHLAEFVKANSQISFSYFITDNYWCRRQTSFLSSLCQQMRAVIGGKAENELSIDNPILDSERLKDIFGVLVERIVEIARKTNSTFYFVIDGLEWAFEGKPGERISDLLPLQTKSKHLYFLGSISSSVDHQLNFNHLSEEPRTFSNLDTKTYLERGGISVSKELLEKIQSASGGVPGYLSALRKLHIEKIQDITQAIEKPADIEDLLKIQWSAFAKKANDTEKLTLAIIAYSVTPIASNDISEMTKQNSDELDRLLISSGLMHQTKDKRWMFYPDLLKKIAHDRLQNFKNDSIKHLITYYENRKSEKETGVLLPEYYLMSNDYSGIESLLKPPFITNSIDEFGDLGAIRRALGHAKELAYQHSEKQGVIQYALLSSQLRSLSNEVIGESEVRALISLGEFDKALELTYSIKISILRVRLLARIYSSMEKKGMTIPKSSLDELKQMAEGLENEDLDPEEILLTASDIFPVLPDVSTAIIDKIKGQQNAQTAMDLIYALASIQSTSVSDDNVIEKIEDKNIQEMALTSPWLAKLTSTEIINKALSASHTKAKVFLLREWCQQNKSDPKLHNVIEATLDIIVSDANYKIPLRNLRQLSTSLRNCAPDQINQLAHRFDVPNFTSLRSPIEERVRLELNIAEAVNLVSPDQGWERFWQTYTETKNLPLDTDVSCYCYTRFLISLTLLDPQDIHKLSGEIKTKLEDEFIRLIDTSADQLDISKRILRALSFVKPDLALTFAGMLNTTKRRDEGIRESLVAYMRQDRLPIKISIIEDGLNGIKDEAYRTSTIIRLVETGNGSAKLSDLELRNYFSSKIDRINDPILVCKGLAQLIIANNKEDDVEIRKEIFTRLINSWQEIDIAWIRTEAAFDLASQIGNIDQQLAMQLYESAVELREATALANQTLGRMFLETLQTAVRPVAFIDIQHQDGKFIWDELIQLVELIPSRSLKIYVLSKIALARFYKKGDKDTFNRLMQDHVLPELQLLASSDVKNRIVANISTAIYEYSPEEAVKLIKALPYNQRNFAWADMSARILLQINIGDDYDHESPNTPIDLQRANKVVSIMENVDNDEFLCFIVDILTHLTGLQNSHLNESQKLDILTRLDTIVDKKLPDINNIDHLGYKVLAKSSIEAARRHSTKKAKTIKKTHNQIIQEAKSIDNIADRVFVMSIVARDFKEIENQIAISLVDEAFSLIESIPNVKDRIDRLEVIANSYSELNNTSRSDEAVRLGVHLSSSLDGIERDTVLASLIQTAHQVDKNIAAEITEKVEDPKTEYELDVHNTSYDLSKSPHKLTTQFETSSKNDEIMRAALGRMMKAVNSNKGVPYSPKTILDWLAAGSQLKFETMLEIIDWTTEVNLRQCPDSALPNESIIVLRTIIENCRILYGIGNQILPLVKIPESLKGNFQGLSISKKLFKVGERNRAISWIKTWLQGNASRYVSICDPYFDEEQVWILQCVPADVQVKIITSGRAFGFIPSINDTSEVKKNNRQRAKSDLLTAWGKISNQSCPPTFVVIHSSVYEGDKDKFHDRYIITDGGGVSIGTSLNGLGKQESFITILNPDDVKYVEATYINPKLSIDQFFSQVIYFELDE
jgi:hypothetical protein